MRSATWTRSARARCYSFMATGMTLSQCACQKNSSNKRANPKSYGLYRGLNIWSQGRKPRLNTTKRSAISLRWRFLQEPNQAKKHFLVGILLLELRAQVDI